MLLFSKPSEAEMARFVDQARQWDFSYSQTGATQASIPPRFTVDHNRIRLGAGPEIWSRAVESVRTWRMFDIDWIRFYSPSTPIVPGENVAVVASYLNCYWLNACRIVYVIAEDGPVKRFGFAYGTLREHADSGEERFLVEQEGVTGEVWYDILAFSRPNQFLSRIGYPLARKLQKRFAAASKAAMLHAVNLPVVY